VVVKMITDFDSRFESHLARLKYSQKKNIYYLKCEQCDQAKIAKCLQKLPKNDFTRKRIDFDIFTKIA